MTLSLIAPLLHNSLPFHWNVKPTNQRTPQSQKLHIHTNPQPNMASTQFTDYYSLLEIAVESDAKTINKAYRKKALQYHPDKNKGDAKASKQL